MPRAVLIVAIATSLLILSGTPARSTDAHWQLRATGALGDTGGSLRTDLGLPDGGTLEIETDELEGWGLALDYRFGERLGLSLSWLDGEIDTRVNAAVAGRIERGGLDLGLSILALGLDLDLLPARRLDLLVGPALAWVDYDDPTVTFPGTRRVGRTELDDEVTWGLRARIDVPVGRWVVSGGVESYDATAEISSDGTQVGIDPLILMAGAGIRF